MNQQSTLHYSNGAYLSEPSQVLDAIYSQLEHPAPGNIVTNPVARSSFGNPSIFSEASLNMIAQPPLNSSIHSGPTPNLNLSGSFTTGAAYSTQPANLNDQLASYTASIHPVQSPNLNFQLYSYNSGICSYQSPNLIGQYTSRTPTAYSEPSPSLNGLSPFSSASTCSAPSPNLNGQFPAHINSYQYGQSSSHQPGIYLELSPNQNIQSSCNPGLAYSNYSPNLNVQLSPYYAGINSYQSPSLAGEGQPSSYHHEFAYSKRSPNPNLQPSYDPGFLYSNQLQNFDSPSFSNNGVVYSGESTNLREAQPLIHPHNGCQPNSNQDPELQPQQLCDQLLEIFGYNQIPKLPAEGVLSQPLQSGRNDSSVCGSIQVYNTVAREELGTVNTPAQDIEPNWYFPESSAVHHNESVPFSEQNVTISQQVYESPAQLEAYSATTSGLPVAERDSQPIPSGNGAIDDPIVPKKNRTRKRPVRKSKPNNTQPTASSSSNGALSDTQQGSLAQINSAFGLLDAYDTLHGDMNPNMTSATSTQAAQQLFASGSEVIQAPIASGSRMKPPTATKEKIPRKQAPKKKRHCPCDHPGCSHIASSPWNLWMHRHVHLPEPIYICPVVGCTKRYQFPSDLDRHDKRVHRGIITSEKREAKTIQKLKAKLAKKKK